MFTLQVLNDAGEWELIDRLFASEDAADDFFYDELADAFDTYMVEDVAPA